MVNNYCSFEIEQLFNVYRSIDDPHCSICIMLNPSKVISLVPTYRNVDLILIMINI